VGKARGASVVVVAVIGAEMAHIGRRTRAAIGIIRERNMILEKKLR
jgi:hypothetical protein